jgi:hypothetical protein
MERPFRIAPVTVPKGGLLTRYDAVVDGIRNQIRAFHAEAASEVYHFPPVLVAENVNPSVLLKLHSAVEGFHVKSVVRDRNLYVVSLSDGYWHSVGVPDLSGQTTSWSHSPGQFMVLYDAIMPMKKSGSRSPVITVQLRPGLLLPGVQSCRRGEKVCSGYAPDAYSSQHLQL